ncbi:MAG: DUF393 domain-containing protein [Pseudomonadota bacterium]
MSDQPTCDVIYNGDCPVCRAGIEAMRGEARYTDIVETPEILREHGLTERDVQYRLHVLTPEGRLVRGIDAAALTMQASPRWRWLGRLAATPLLRPVGSLAYEVLAAILFRWNRWRGNF